MSQQMRPLHRASIVEMCGESTTVSPDDIFDACYNLLVNGKRPLVEALVCRQDQGSHGSRNTLNFNEP